MPIEDLHKTNIDLVRELFMSCDGFANGGDRRLGYIVNDNYAGAIIGDFIDTSNDGGIVSGGGSAIYDYLGNVIAEAQDATSQLVIGTVDIMALRKFREAGTDGVSGFRAELYAPYYARTIFPPNKILKEGPLEHVTDPKVLRWKAEATANRAGLYDFYSEKDVK